MPENHLLNEWWENVGKGLAVFGRDLSAVLKTAQHLKDAVFVNIEERVVKIPIGPWAKDKKLRTIGLYCRASIEDGLEGLSLGPMARGMLFSGSTSYLRPGIVS
jgi:hypothetical protein